jgi:alpha-amylase
MMRFAPRLALSALALLLSLTLFHPAATVARADTPSAQAAPDKAITTSSVGIQMFMWPWVSLTSECTSTLGPEGIDWILVSPPQEDIHGPQWWTHYQPVSYKLDSQLGTADQFASMVAACNKAGVQVIVDAVINHMANSSGTGFAGTNFTKYNYPGLYAPTDFHGGLDSTDPNYCSGSISNYNDALQVVHCELGGLPDLATEKASVRQSIADYLNHLTDLGVAGFRIDAAKHIGLTDLTAIRKLLKPVNGAAPYFLQESIGSSEYNEPWTAIGDVFAWDYQAEIADIFNGQVKFAQPNDQRIGIIGDANSTVIMVSNHDTEHHTSKTITYRDPKKYLAASAFLLADSLGKPMLYTGYAFSPSDTDTGPAVKSGDVIAPAVCPAGKLSQKPQVKYKTGTFICMERWSAVKGMIQWHHEVGSAPMTMVTSANKLFAFTRASGFFAMNGNQAYPGMTTKLTIKSSVKSGLPQGVYCDLISGGAAPISKGKCLGSSVTVAQDGTAKVAIPPMTVVAVDAASKLK